MKSHNSPRIPANRQGVGEQSPSKPRCVACGKMMLTEPLFQGERQARTLWVLSNVDDSNHVKDKNNQFFLWFFRVLGFQHLLILMVHQVKITLDVHLNNGQLQRGWHAWKSNTGSLVGCVQQQVWCLKSSKMIYLTNMDFANGHHWKSSSIFKIYIQVVLDRC